MDKNGLDKTALNKNGLNMTGWAVGAAALLGLFPWYYSTPAIAELGSHPTMNVTWVERYGFIIPDSVCVDHDFGSMDRHECKMAAKKIFTDECQARQHIGEADTQRVKFCRAADLF